MNVLRIKMDRKTVMRCDGDDCMKKISICICCYNEEGNVYDMYSAVSKEMKKLEDRYDHEIIFSDNDSKDDTRNILKTIAQKDDHVKVILNTRNFGATRSGLNCAFRSTGDCMILLPCDFQTPPELIPQWIRLWEEGNKIVCGQKVRSRESRLKYFLRNVFYGIIKLSSEVPQYEHLTGLMLIDEQILNVMRETYEADADFRFLIADLGYKIKIVPYEQQERRAGKSSYNIARYLDFAITSLVNTSWIPLRLATVTGVLVSVICFMVGLVYLVYKLTHWYTFDAGTAPILIGMFFIGAVQLLFIGVVGEYVGSILRKISKSPLVVEEEIINFDK